MTAYDKSYLGNMKRKTSFLFHMFMESGYDFFSCVEKFMSTSRIRALADIGNSTALNKSPKQMFNDIDYSDLPKQTEDYMDFILAEWLAYVYVQFQWMYNIPSSEIVKAMPPRAVCETYNPFHETSIKNACEKLHYKFWELKECSA